MFPAFAGITYYRVRAHRTQCIALLRFVMLWLLWQEGFVIDVVDHRGTSSGVRVYRKEITEGEHNK